MAHAARSMSPKERRDAKNARILIGREDQQGLFTRSLLQPEHREAKLIFSISGQGGVGKTTLLKEFRRIAEEHRDVVAYVDEGMVTNRVEDVPEALHRLVEDLERQGCRFEEFRKQYKAYRIKRQEMEAEPEAPKGFVGDGVRGLAKIGIEAGKGLVPFGGMVDSEMVAAFYEERRSALGLEVGKEAEDKIWREYSLEWIYHTICAAPQASLGVALNGFLMALKRGTIFAQSWAKAMVQAGQETDCVAVRKWGEQLRDGMIAAREKRYADMIPGLTAVLGSDFVEEKWSAVAWNWRGYCYRELGQQEMALQDARKAVEIDGGESQYQFGLALTYQNLKDFEKAIENYEKAIEMSPENAYSYNNLGNCHRDEKRYEEAFFYYEKTLLLPDSFGTPASAHALANRNLGGVYREKEDYSKAIECYLRAIELNPQYTNAYLNLGITYNAQKDYSQAIDCYLKAIELNPQYANAYNNLGITYKAQKEYSKAIEY